MCERVRADIPPSRAHCTRYKHLDACSTDSHTHVVCRFCRLILSLCALVTIWHAGVTHNGRSLHAVGFYSPANERQQAGSSHTGVPKRLNYQFEKIYCILIINTAQNARYIAMAPQSACSRAREANAMCTEEGRHYYFATIN